MASILFTSKSRRMNHLTKKSETNGIHMARILSQLLRIHFGAL